MAPLRHCIELLVNPLFLCFFLLACCLLMGWSAINKRWVKNTLLLVLLLIAVFGTGWLPCYLTHQLESHYPVITQVNPEIKWIVVLSGGQNKVAVMPANDLLSSASMKRLIEGVRLFRELPEATLVLSGGGSEGEPPEAELLNELTGLFLISPKSILLEKQSINTVDQARELRHIVHDEPFYLVTSAIHMPRSMRLCQQQGLHPVAAPTDFTFFWYTERWAKMIIPNSYNLAYSSIALHELLGQLWNVLTR